MSLTEQDCLQRDCARGRGDDRRRLVLVAYVVVGALVLLCAVGWWLVDARLDREHARTEQFLHAATPSPIDRVRAELER